MRSEIRDILILVLAYKIVRLALEGTVGIGVVVIAALIVILTIWFLLEKYGIL
ncbi:MAG: hypothetical protein ABIB71_01145 [Candidatus Woesearchaeota archaeon]